MTYGSYLGKKENIVSSSSVICVTDTSVAFLAGLMIFPLVFSQGISPSQGPPLVFFVLPKIFQQLGPMLGRVIGGSFFLLLCFAALTSTISLLEVPVAYLVDQKRFPRKRAVWLLVILIYILGLPSMMSQGSVSFFNTLRFYRGRDFLTFISDVCDISLTIGGCLMCIFIAKQWKIKNLNKELAQGDEAFSTSFIKKYLDFTIQYVCPVLLGILSVLIIVDKFWGLFEG